MHLVSLEAQTAVVDGQSFDFEARRVHPYGNLAQIRCADLFRAWSRAQDGISKKCGLMRVNPSAYSASRPLERVR